MAETVFIGKSVEHRQLLETLAKVARTDAEVLITGPSGVGKELYAKYVHECSPRRQAAIVPVNCGVLPADLLENELFGHVGGAFTGARPNSEGLVAAAERGTLFLDEVDSLSLAGQVKLLRFLQEKEYRRLGETRIRRANVRIIAATNADLLAAVRGGRFREDLFFRLRVVPIEVPPLRARRSDILLLVEGFAARFAAAYGLPLIAVSDAAIRRLTSYDWPGNIRELENCIKYLTCLQLDRPIIPSDLPLLVASTPETESPPTDDSSEVVPSESSAESVDLTTRPYNDVKRELVNELERTYLCEALRRSNGNIAEAARQSKKPRRVFFAMMRKHGIKARGAGP